MILPGSIIGSIRNRFTITIGVDCLQWKNFYLSVSYNLFFNKLYLLYLTVILLDDHITNLSFNFSCSYELISLYHWKFYFSILNNISGGKNMLLLIYANTWSRYENYNSYLLQIKYFYIFKKCFYFGHAVSIWLVV